MTGLMVKCLGSKCVSCVISTVRWVPVVFVSAIICWAYYTYVVPFCFEMIEGIGQRIVYLAIFHLCISLFLWAYVQTVFSPIGKPSEMFKLPLRVRDELGAANSEAEFKAVLDRFVRDQRLPISSKSIDGAVRYCLKCSCVKPDRSHHCSVCGHCILKFDHHCPWVNTCVNFNNYKYFILFLGYGFVLCLFGFFSILPYFISFWQSQDLAKTNVSKFLVFFLFFVAAMFGLSMGCLFFYHLFLISKNQSTVESFRPPIFSYGQDKNGYNLGIKRNFQEIFGSNKLKWLLPVFSSPGDGIKYPQNPSVAETVLNGYVGATERRRNFAHDQVQTPENHVMGMA